MEPKQNEKIYSSYTPAQKKATYLYRAKNHEAYNAYQRAYHKEQMETNEGYRQRKAASAQRANAKTRALKAKQEQIEAEKKIKIIYSDTNIDEEIKNEIIKNDF